jgi:hypothetical protein
MGANSPLSNKLSKFLTPLFIASNALHYFPANVIRIKKQSEAKMKAIAFLALTMALVGCDSGSNGAQNVVVSALTETSETKSEKDLKEERKKAFNELDEVEQLLKINEMQAELKEKIKVSVAYDEKKVENYAVAEFMYQLSKADSADLNRFNIDYLLVTDESDIKYEHEDGKDYFIVHFYYKADAKTIDWYLGKNFIENRKVTNDLALLKNRPASPEATHEIQADTVLIKTGSHEIQEDVLFSEVYHKGDTFWVQDSYLSEALAVEATQDDLQAEVQAEVGISDL